MRIMAVGVGKDVNKKELQTIAMGDPGHVFRVRKYKNLLQIINGLLLESCHGGRFFFGVLLTIVTRARVRYDMIDSQRLANSAELVIIILYLTNL